MGFSISTLTDSVGRFFSEAAQDVAHGTEDLVHAATNLVVTVPQSLDGFDLPKSNPPVDLSGAGFDDQNATACGATGMERE